MNVMDSRIHVPIFPGWGSSADNEPMTELILIRHGETDWNRELRFQGHLDVPLNDMGHEQARRLGVRLAGESVQQLVCSDLLRTRQTAQPVVAQVATQLAPGFSLEAVLDANLREQSFGVMEGLRAPDIALQHPQDWAQWLEFGADHAFARGESTRSFHARVMAAVQRLATVYAGQTVVVVTHGGVLDMIYRTARALPLSGPRQSEIPNAGVNRVRLRDGLVEILDWADTRHLADLPEQPRYEQRSVAAKTEG
jgi:probable phosphoglycerate mutase